MASITLEDGSRADLPPVERLAGSNCGTPGVWRFEGAAPGPQLTITALVHGNEVCGAVAADRIVQSAPRPARGTLTVVFCNLEAYARLDDQTKSRCRSVDEDLNRVWGRLDAPAAAADTYELRRAREILPFVGHADVLLDLHSMTSPAPALGLVGACAKNVEMARAIGYPALLVKDAGHAAGLRLIDRKPYGDGDAPQLAMLVECGQHFAAVAIAAAHETVARTIARYLEGRTLAAPQPQVLLEVTQAVTIHTDRFAWVRDWPNMARVAQAGTLVGRDGDTEVRTPHDDAWMVMPASEAFRKPGQTAVRFARAVSAAPSAPSAA